MRACARAAACLLLLVYGGAACDSSPSGPGSLVVTAEAGTPLGAVTLEVVGAGVTGFEGRGSTHAYGGVVATRQNRHRVVLVDPVGGGLQVEIRVEDVRADPPVITAVAAAGTDNAARPPTDVTVSIVRP